MKEIKLYDDFEDGKSTYTIIKVGDIVKDDLTTGEICIVIEILSDTRLRLNNNYLDGYRYTWELTKV